MPLWTEPLSIYVFNIMRGIKHDYSMFLLLKSCDIYFDSNFPNCSHITEQVSLKQLWTIYITIATIFIFYFQIKINHSKKTKKTNRKKLFKIDELILSVSQRD